jgi:hypothetical protein
MRRSPLVPLIALTLAACATVTAPVPPDDVLRAKAVEVGRSMGLSEPYRDDSNGIFIWHVHLVSPETPAGCNGLFAWYMKRLENGVALDDPMLLQRCGDNAQQAVVLAGRLQPVMRRFQEDFKRRWLDLVGPVRLIGPTSATHSPAALAQAFKAAGEQAH